jgi:acetyl esterase/lipase
LRTVAAKTGSVVVDVGYRLAPEHPFPIPLEDSWAALLYVATHGDEFGVDVGRISIGGFSAGGHISAVLSHWARDRGFPAGAKIVLALLVIPVVDASGLNEDLSVREGSFEGVSVSSSPEFF